jgi:hypothetical protein
MFSFYFPEALHLFGVSAAERLGWAVKVGEGCGDSFSERGLDQDFHDGCTGGSWDE